VRTSAKASHTSAAIWQISTSSRFVSLTTFCISQLWRIRKTIPVSTGCSIKKQPPKKKSISRKPCNLNSWNLHHIILRNTTEFSENFFHIIHMKQKLQLSELKKDNFATAHTSSLAQYWLSRNSPKFIRKEEWPPNSHDLNPLDYHGGVRCLTSVNAMYWSQRTFRSWRPSWRRSGLTCHKAQLMTQYCHFAKGFRHALKQLVDILNMLCKLMFVTLTFPFHLQLRHLVFRVIPGWLELLFTE